MVTIFKITIFLCVRSETGEHKLTMQCCWRLLAAQAPRPKARQVAFSNCALKWTQARTSDNVAYELFRHVYVSGTQTSLPFGFPHFPWQWVGFFPILLFFSFFFWQTFACAAKRRSKRNKTTAGDITWICGLAMAMVMFDKLPGMLMTLLSGHFLGL